MKPKEFIFKFFSDYIYKEVGIVYQAHDQYRLETRLNTIQKTLNLNSLDEVYDLFANGANKEQKQLLTNISTNNETYFMRDQKPFKALGQVIIPELLKDLKNFKINIWSAGCSTGQEVCSMLMAIDNFSGAEALSRIQIDATDISSQALDKAKKGIYDGLEVQRGLPAPYLVKYFNQKEDASWIFNEKIHGRANFKEFNLLTGNFPKDLYHVIFCRNVLIYQDMSNRTKILAQFLQALKPNGYLFMGSGESMIGTKLSFKQESVTDAMVFRKAG